MTLAHTARRLACASALALLFLVYGGALAAGILAAHPPASQYRDHIAEAPSPRFPLGTDDLGRDRFSRLLHGSRVSLVLAPAAAALAVAIGALMGAFAAVSRGWVDHALSALSDLTLALPWFFLLVTLRAVLPMDLDPALSLSITFLLLGTLGWAGPARVVRAGVRQMLESSHVLAARARGAGAARILAFHVAPGLSPVLGGQFLALMPVFLIAEANLGLLGLGVSESNPSLGNLLRELESVAAYGPAFILNSWWLLAAPLVLFTVTASLFFLSAKEVNS